LRPKLDDAPSEQVCALAGRFFLDTAARVDHVEAWRQFVGQITPDDPKLRQLLQAGSEEWAAGPHTEMAQPEPQTLPGIG
jgi:hypothetical protein